MKYTVKITDKYCRKQWFNKVTTLVVDEGCPELALAAAEKHMVNFTSRTEVLPPHDQDEELYDSDSDVEVCQTDTEADIIMNPDTEEVTINIPENP